MRKMRDIMSPRGRGRDRLDQPPGRHRAPRRGDGIGRALRAARATPARFCRRQPHGLVDHRRMRERGPAASDHHHRPVGQGDSGTSGQPDRAEQPQGPRVLMKGSATRNSLRTGDRLWVSAKVISYPAGSGDVSPASEMGPAVRHDLGATWPGYVSIMVWLGRGRQPGWGGALVFSRQGCPRTDLDEPN